MATEQKTKVDAVTFSIVTSAYINLVDEIVNTVKRSCMSLAIFVGDFSGGLMDSNGDLVAMGTRDISVHVGAIQPSTKAVIEDFKGKINPGDVFVFNDPYRGGTHLPDMTFIRPVFWDGNLIAFTATKGHWADVGGSTPGSMNPLATEIYKEGLQVPPMKLYDRGEFRADIEKMILSNLRLEEECGGDMRAQVEATKTGETRLHQLIDKYGIETILTCFQDNIDLSEKELIAELQQYPEGTWEGEDFIDCDPNNRDAGPVRIHVKMTLTHNPTRIVYDVRGSGPATHSGMNGTAASSFGALVAGTKYVFPKPLLNAGWLRVISAEYPESSVLNCIRPQACCGEVSGSYEKVLHVIMRIWSQVRPERVFASCYNLEYFLGGGYDDRPNEEGRYFMYYHWHNGGWGARYGLDGRDGGAPLFGCGLQQQSIEHMERLWPVFIEQYGSKIDSMGAGKWRGGIGSQALLRIMNSSGTIMSYTSDRGKYGPGGPPGLFGGKRGIHQGVTKNIGMDNEEYLDVVFSDVLVKKGETMHHYSAGGGGYGNPLEREPHAVLEDVLDEFVSIEAAKTEYGVVINAVDPDILDYRIDEEATTAIRLKMSQNGSSSDH